MFIYCFIPILETQLVKEIVAECSKLRCDVCHDWKSFIPADSSQAEYVEHPFWGQNYCPSHEGTTRKCCSCERLEPKDTKYFVLDDGRHLCPECQESAIMDSDQCQSLYLEVQKFYEDHDMKLGHQIRLQLVGRQKLNRVMKGDQSNCDGEIRAVCLEAKEILIWYGLPRLLTGSILAQEMIKAWLMLQVYPHFKLSAEVERGICGVLAYSWLEYYSSDPDSSKIWSDFEKKLVEFIKHQIESSDYGEVFRKANKVVHEYGLCTSAIEHIVRSMYFKVVKQLQYTSISAPSASSWKYDVFLSFRGETRMGFTSHLDKALKMEGINVFTDSLIKRGASIPATLLTAILKSRFAIIVLSQNYTSSMWCLDEVTKALQCMDKRSAVFPIFYHVDPSDVRYDKMGAYQRHSTRRYLKKTTVQDWTMSVREVTNVSGWVSSGSRRVEDEIITHVVNELRNRVVCAGCNRRINETSYLRCNHRVWHQECFR
ncbi:putative transcription factor interactor and regulator LIM family [Rosa chinensis]|uniref:Putative transcription factor interactor and regulator LIM family n=1 Tax=Rosa chinensis TaxID=74649 RepID=A0A2P6PB52_ROSCH|nr:putative transcription factor interactor and regulator LIM family [Rosa chinensis]